VPLKNKERISLSWDDNADYLGLWHGCIEVIVNNMRVIDLHLQLQ
jgi:hypothetical protein